MFGLIGFPYTSFMDVDVALDIDVHVDLVFCGVCVVLVFVIVFALTDFLHLLDLSNDESDLDR